MRALPLALAFSLAIALVTVPTAAAQVNTNTCGPFTLTSATPDNVAPGAIVSVTVSVKNEGNLAAIVNVSAAFASSDVGWHVSPSSQTASNLQPGATAPTIFSVAADAGAAKAATLNVAATGACSGPGPLPCPAPQCTTQAKALSVPLTLQTAQGLRIPGLDALGFPVEYLVASIV